MQQAKQRYNIDFPPTHSKKQLDADSNHYDSSFFQDKKWKGTVIHVIHAADEEKTVEIGIK